MANLTSPFSVILSPANLVSFLSLGLSFAAGLALHDGRRSLFAGLLALSCFADIVDGKFANLFERSKEEKRVGIELDSLVDAIAFGVLPAWSVVIFLPGSILSSVAAFGYLLAVVARLAFYNVATSEDYGAFVGLPCTIAALFWVWFLLLPSFLSLGPLLFGLLAALMVAPLRVPRPRTRGILLLLALVLCSSAAHLFWG
jgi:phosphatidylserine synthase